MKHNLIAEAAALQQAVVLAVDLDRDPEFESNCEETCLLAAAAGYQVTEVIRTKRHHPDRKTFIGSGKLAEIKSCLSFHKASTLILNHTLSDGQHARLETGADTELLDYSGLILTIFAKRATTSAGKLQVELAQEIYGRSKLKGAWTHLERQRGGLGATGGPGERQLELDRRMAASKIGRLRKRLAKSSRHVELVTRSRKQRAYTVALVGYTNAGKSTLFGSLTGADVGASSRLFETLTTTSRQLHLGEKVPHGSAVLSDTVGFVRNLPHELIDAFQSTLLEAVQADLLLVVVDASDRAVGAKLTTIFSTIKRIGAGEVPCILVCNKCDLGPNQLANATEQSVKIISAVEVSARTGNGLDDLREHLRNHFHTITQGK